MTSDNYLLFAEITEQLEKIKAGHSFTWAKLGLLILSVDIQRYWEVNHSSFTSWIEEFAALIKKKESSCWRFMASARFYINLRKRYNSDGNSYPKLQDLSEKVSPENLELLAKLEPVLPNDYFIKLAVRVIESDVKRNEIREIWSTFRPMLDGKTKRGLKKISNISVDIKRQKEFIHELDTIQNLLLKRGSWLNLPDGHVCKHFKDFIMKGSIRGHEHTFGVEVLIMEASVRENKVNFHLVDYLVMVSDGVIEKVKTLSNKANFYWIIGNKESLLNKIDQLPADVGIIFDVNGEIEVYKTAQFKEVDQSIFFKKVIFETAI